MVELLAPAGDCDAGYAALEYGADAVYLGLSKFSARAEAVNFTPDQLAVFTQWAHAHGKRVLVAVNTLIFEPEIPDLIDTLQTISDVGANGVIVQDLGVARLIKTHFPHLPLHASTQMAVHNREGAETLRRFGFKRVVLARELTFEEIEDICRNVDIEVEAFIHGALCYSYSGLCLFSAMFTGRSANRGKCVYPCREKFKTADGEGFCFSMKDLSLETSVRRLRDAGVAALKIEGRKKTALYTAAVSDYYRAVLDGTADEKTLRKKRDAMATVFNRSPTTLYTQNRKNADVADVKTVGHKGLRIGTVKNVFKKNDARFVTFKTSHPFMRYDGIQLEIDGLDRPFGFSAETVRIDNKNVFSAAAGQTVSVALPKDAPFVQGDVPVYLASSAEVKKSYPYTVPRTADYLPRRPVDVAVFLTPEGITAAADGVSETANIPLSVANKPELVEKSVRASFEKTDTFALSLNKLTIDNPDALFAPAAALNDVRRRLFERVDAARKAEKAAKDAALKETILKKETVAPAADGAAVSYLIKTDDPEKLSALTPDDFEKISEIDIEIDDNTVIPPFLPKEKIRLCLPTVCRDRERDGLKKRVDFFIAEGFKKWEAANLWAFSVLPADISDITADWTLYVANASAARFLFDKGVQRVVASPEIPDPSGLFAAFPDRVCAMIYEDLPLFISETCHKKTLAGKCVSCGGTYNEKASCRYGEVEFAAKNCRLRVLASRPRVKKTEALKAGARLLRMDFVYRKTTPQQVAKTVRTLFDM